VLIRRLPPGMTEDEFWAILGDEWKPGKGKADWVRYHDGEISTECVSLSLSPSSLQDGIQTNKLPNSVLQIFPDRRGVIFMSTVNLRSLHSPKRFNNRNGKMRSTLPMTLPLSGRRISNMRFSKKCPLVRNGPTRDREPSIRSLSL
jgi:hypothetical protein